MTSLAVVAFFLAMMGQALAKTEKNATIVVSETRTLQIEAKKSQVKWLAKKVTGQHDGTVALKSGEVVLKGEDLVGGRFEIDMTSIRVSDLKDAGPNAKLKNHLKSEDFFDVEKYPTALFTITKSKKAAEGEYDVKGDLTIKGIKRPISFPMKLESDAKEYRALGGVELDRTLWNVRYGSGKFFKGLGDKLIYDKFQVSFDVTAKK